MPSADAQYCGMNEQITDKTGQSSENPQLNKLQQHSRPQQIKNSEAAEPVVSCQPVLGIACAADLHKVIQSCLCKFNTESSAVLIQYFLITEKRNASEDSTATH